MNIIIRQNKIQYRLAFWIEHCILAVAFFLPLSLNAASVFLALGAVLWLGKMLTAGRMDLRATPFDTLIALLVALSALSILVSPDRGLSFYNYYHLMGRYLVLYYLVVNNVQSMEQLKRLVITVLVSSGLVVAYGFYQYILGVDISAFEWVDGEQFPDLKMRVFSTLHNPNLLASFLVVMMAIAGGLGLHTNRFRDKAVYFGLVLALGTCLVLTYSRGAWLSVLAVISLYGFLYNKRLLWLLILLPIGIMAGHEVVMERLMSIANPTDTSATLRIALWESTLAMIAHNPFLGIGWGAYSMVYPEYDFFVLDAGTKIFHAHNMYLHIAAEIGIPGLLAFLGLICGHAVVAFRLAASARNRWTGGLMMGVLAALLGIAVSGFTDYTMFSTQMSMLFWLLNAMVMVVRLERYRYK